jgi:hypothetical protein
MKTETTGIGFGTVLFLLFLALKLTGHIDWSWWWVTAPLWIGIAFAFVLIALVGVFACIVAVLER